MQGHWLLAKLGKRILRPGGRALTGAQEVGLERVTQDGAHGPGCLEVLSADPLPAAALADDDVPQAPAQVGQVLPLKPELDQLSVALDGVMGGDVQEPLGVQPDVVLRGEGEVVVQALPQRLEELPAPDLHQGAEEVQQEGGREVIL